MTKDSESKPLGSDYIPPEGSRLDKTFRFGANDLERSFAVHAEWMLLRKRNEPAAEMFHVAYMENGPTEERPITFVFNGGPGAASAFLYLEVAGPYRVFFEPDGTPPAPPVELVENGETWLDFTDLVFLDPIGTGFSQTISSASPGKNTADAKDSGRDDKAKDDDSEFYDLKRDLESLGEFIRRFLSKHGRWRSPVCIAGESYGGFRVARLAKLLQYEYGIGLSAAIIISPAFEFSFLTASDYDLLRWIDLFPSMMLSAHRHGRTEGVSPQATFSEVRSIAERFAVEELVPALMMSQESPERIEILEREAKYLGIDVATIVESSGRIRPAVFARKLLRDRRLVCGSYDASITSVDPYPDRESYEGPDSTLAGVGRLFTAGINSYLRQDLGLETDREYHLLSRDASSAWRVTRRNNLASQVGSVDELRFGMSINPHMSVLISHGYYDLATPYYASNRIVDSMKLDPSIRSNLHIEHYQGGHMFYTWESSRKAFTKRVKSIIFGSAESDDT